MPSRKMAIIFSVCLCLVVFPGGGYFYFFHYKPFKESMETLKTSISNEENSTNRLDKSKKQDSGDLKKKSADLQKMLPVSALVDQFLLQLQEAEAASGSLITRISFAKMVKILQQIQKDRHKKLRIREIL
ncbi:hypothetical protein ELQ35_14500 [Peribacillus cavernae]|uniref:Uncharacterized protein n=1 Tax=Peribacillus cavernae TaxID=1674310 RepID=A0A433HHP7_9BACI|nr:hypothetical protein [Peribacillus cavernae]MDQ0219379.1 Tfp pilus assembly protein PilO [Peribacillus cavernae]RUQ27745.1 hypothetical protein ELQ35_14500 [Peribacillus cavernae]